MTLQLYMNLQIYMWVSWNSTLHYIDYNSVVHNNDVVEMDHDMNQHDKDGITFTLLVVSMLSCNAAEWWMCSWCIIASPSHGKVCEVFNGLGVCLMLHVHVSPSLVLSMLHMFAHLRTSLLACDPCSSRSLSHHVTSMYLYLQWIMTRRHQIQKSPSLPWCIFFTFGCRWLGERTRL